MGEVRALSLMSIVVVDLGPDWGWGAGHVSELKAVTPGPRWWWGGREGEVEAFKLKVSTCILPTWALLSRGLRSAACKYPQRFLFGQTYPPATHLYIVDNV